MYYLDLDLDLDRDLERDLRGFLAPLERERDFLPPPEGIVIVRLYIT
jgi:hypothetical protein